jgi:hypothetical protein
MIEYKEGICTNTLHLNKAANQIIQIPIRAPEEAVNCLIHAVFYTSKIGKRTEVKLLCTDNL